MDENKIGCSVVRDLLPTYIEDLTESETSDIVKNHLSQCPSCRAVEDDMRTSVPVEKVPERSLNFLKRVKHTRLIAAVLTAVVVFGCIWWLYDHEFHYANTEAGRLAAVEDYIPHPEDPFIPIGIVEGTPLSAVSWAEYDGRLFIFFTAENNENIRGIIHLVPGINGKYRAIEANYSTSQYTGGIYGKSLNPDGIDRSLFMLSGFNCRDIYKVEIQFTAYDYYNGVFIDSAPKTYDVTDSDFLWIMDEKELMQELGWDATYLVRLEIGEFKLLDKNGNDITSQYKDDSAVAYWVGATGTAERFLLYVYIGIVALLGLPLIRYFLRRDRKIS